jgi:hypothetical protein
MENIYGGLIGEVIFGSFLGAMEKKISKLNLKNELANHGKSS